MVILDYDVVLGGLTAFVAAAILISGLDDFLIDVCYYGNEIRQRLTRSSRRKITEADLRAKPEQPIAIMIPAWHEDAVIAKMLTNTLRTVEYSNYDIFIGTYPNDEATMLSVAEIAQTDARIHRIVCPHDGPTNKADCLNWIIEGIRIFDKNSGKGIKIFMLHDSEDLVHPLSFKLMNYFIPGVPMVQLPVIPFETPAREWTAGTYLDEFAESHIKDLRVRELLSGMVPSAGVGTGFSREAIDKLAAKHNNQIFNVGTFTEDYDLAFRLKAIGGSSILLQFFIERTKLVSTGWFKKKERLKVVHELVGTQEYFPSNFYDAVRQKARWTLGIVFHGWQQRGWEGGWALRYMTWRDRKTLMTNSVNMLGYLLLLEAGINAHMGRHYMPSDSWVWRIIQADAVLLFNRCAQRVISIARISNARQAGLSLPRIIWGNVINFCAVAKATYLFIRTNMMGEKLVWAKTAHAFPSEDQLSGFKRKLGDLMLENRLLTLADLSQAIEIQKKKHKFLGEILVDRGFAAEKDVIAVLAAQMKTESRHLEYELLDREGLGLIPESAAREHLMVVADAQARPMLIAAADITDGRMRKWLDANFPHPYRLALGGRKNIVEVIDRHGAESPRDLTVDLLSAEQAAAIQPLTQ